MRSFRPLITLTFSTLTPKNIKINFNSEINTCSSQKICIQVIAFLMNFIINGNDIIDPQITSVFQAPKMIQSQRRNSSSRCTRRRTKTKTKPSTLTSPVPRTQRTSGWSSPRSKTPSWDTISKSSTWFSAHFILTLFWGRRGGDCLMDS